MPGLFVGRAAVLVAIATVLVSGCARKPPPDPVSAADLQNGIAKQLDQARTPAKSVKCPEPLASEVGATTRCDVTFSDTDSVTALLTTTKVAAGKTTWEVTQARLSKDQLVKRVSALSGAKDVDCDSGTSGRVGNWVSCQVTKNGVKLNQTAQITEAKGLFIKVSLTEFLPLPQLVDQVAARLTPIYGRRPDSTECSGDLPGTPGSTIDCVATIGDNADSWAVTVTGVSDGAIAFDVARPQRGRSGAIDMCPGCPG
jgi:hypothetical protein